MNSLTGKLDVVISGSADKLAQECDRANAKLDQMVAKAQSSGKAMEGANAGAIASYGHTVDKLKDAAAAVDRLGATTDQLSGKQHTAWLAIGSVVGGTTQTMIERITKFVDATGKSADAAESSFGSIAREMWSTSDALKVVNDRTEQEIAKLQGKTPNNLKLELDEARVAADKLADALDKDQPRIADVLTKNHQSWWHRLLNEGTTSNLEGTVNSQMQQIDDASQQMQLDMHKGDAAGAAKDKQSVTSGLQYLTSKMRDVVAEIDRDKAAGRGPNREVERRESVGVQVYAEGRLDSIHDSDAKASDDATQRRLQQQKDAAAAAQAAAQKALEAERQAAQQRMAAYRAQYAELQRDHTLSTDESILFWERMQASEQRGSDNWIALNEKIGEEIQTRAAKRREDGDRDAQEAERATQEFQRGQRGLGNDLSGADRSRSDAANEIQASRERNTARLDELQTIDRVGKSLTALEAARKLSQDHARGFAEEMSRLNDKQKGVESAGGISETDRANQLAEIGKARQQLVAVRNEQVQSDWDKTHAQPSYASTGFHDAIDEFVDATRQWAQITHDFTLNSLQKLNSTILSDHPDFRSAGSDILRSGANRLLSGAEGRILGAFGAGKKGDSSGNPLFVQDVSMSGNTSLAGMGRSLFSGFKMPDVARVANDAANKSESGGIWSGMAHIVAGLFPGFADGVDNFSGGMAWVGERGRELVKLPTGSSVVPNHKLSDMGGTHHHTWNMDLRGVNDPAQMEQAAVRVFSKLAPHVVNASVASVARINKTFPATRNPLR